MDFAAITLPAVDLLVENPAGKESVSLLGATRFLLDKSFPRAPEKRVKNSVLAGKNERPELRLTLAQERERNPVRVVQLAPLQVSIFGLIGVRLRAELHGYDRASPPRGGRRPSRASIADRRCHRPMWIPDMPPPAAATATQARTARQCLSQREVDSMMSMPASAVRVPFLPEYFRCFRLADRASRLPSYDVLVNVYQEPAPGSHPEAASRSPRPRNPVTSRTPRPSGAR